MKIILSRKGFDGSAGGYASPILPNGTLLSLPIPSDSGIDYSSLSYQDKTYSEIIANLSNNQFAGRKCHLDPDIRRGIRPEPDNWVAAFGQTSTSGGYLRNSHVDVGDIFLFFGWFHKVDDRFNYIEKSPNFYDCSDLHVIYGYLQIAEKITDKDKIKEYRWHPHSDVENYGRNNTLYLPTEKCSLVSKPGYGVLDFAEKRVLTQVNHSRANWVPRPFLMPKYTGRNNSSKCGCLYYAGQWQELVLDSENNPELLDWVKDIIE